MSMPTDNGKDYFIKDFYKRTLSLLNNSQSEYDVALLINSMLGLLIVPKERYFHSIQVSEKYVDKVLLNTIRSAFINEPNISFTEILRRLRNSVCHGNMEIKAERSNLINKPPKIGSIIFQDQNGSSAEIPIDILKRFLINFATNVCIDADEKS